MAASSKIGAVMLIGAGRMGTALLKGWIAGKRFSDIHVIEPKPSAEIAALAAKKAITLHGELPASPPKLAAVVLALKPQVLKDQRTLLAALGTSNGLLLSIAAGVTTSFLSVAAGSAAKVVRAMPNTPARLGRASPLSTRVRRCRDRAECLPKA
jgi:pyrroline-5-carboxylate reductase